MGYSGQWIEFQKKKVMRKKELRVRPGSATFKRGLPGLQTAGLYLTQKEKKGAKPDFLTLKAS